MPTDTRDDTVPASSGTVTATKVAEVSAAAGTAAATGNALADATQALTEAGRVVTTVETGRSLGPSWWRGR
jgi:hypothetical protein